MQPYLKVSKCEENYLVLTFMNKKHQYDLNTQESLEEQGHFPSRQGIVLSMIVPWGSTEEVIPSK